MQPSDKSKEMTEALDNLSFAMFGHPRTKAINENICAVCGSDVGKFRDNLSLKEYTISGMCQVCQDKTFGGAE